MAIHHHVEGGSGPGDSKPTSVWLIRFLMAALLGVGAFYIIAEHRAHVLSVWPLIILLACPLLHLFMHGGHGGHARADDQGGSGGTRG